MVRASRFGVAGIVVAAVAAGAACGYDPGPARIELRGGDARVTVGLAPFEIRILSADGREVLRTLTGGGEEPYGAPAATRDEGPDGIRVISGWDGYRPEERAWAHGATLEPRRAGLAAHPSLGPRPRARDGALPRALAP